MQHATNLAKFSFIYKLLTTTYGKSVDPQYNIIYSKKIPSNVVISAAIAGYLVFGSNNPINTQVSFLMSSTTGFILKDF